VTEIKVDQQAGKTVIKVVQQEVIQEHLAAKNAKL
jgi:hypothetical protein